MVNNMALIFLAISFEGQEKDIKQKLQAEYKYFHTVEGSQQYKGRKTTKIQQIQPFQHIVTFQCRNCNSQYKNGKFFERN